MVERRYQAAKIEIIGVPQLRAALDEIGAQYGKSVERALAKRALRAMLKPVTARMKQDAPRTSRTYAKSVAGRLVRNKRRGFFEAKAGLNVAKRGNRQFHQAHMVTIGTKNRWAGSIMAKDAGNQANRGIGSGARLFRGKVRENRFVITAREGSQSGVLSAGLNAVKEALPKEIEKVRKRHAAKGRK
jgi:hypothetical protein